MIAFPTIIVLGLGLLRLLVDAFGLPCPEHWEDHLRHKPISIGSEREKGDELLILVRRSRRVHAPQEQLRRRTRIEPALLVAA